MRMHVPVGLLAALSLLTLLAAPGAAADPEWHVQRFSTTAPLLDGGDTQNINGPAVIRAPEWLSPRLGEFYMYFADHSGDRIKLACADDLAGPWTVYEPGTLTLQQVRDQADRTSKPGGSWQDTPHIASPDAHVDEANHRIRMYFHAALHQPYVKWGHESGVASSPDGLTFTLDYGKPIGDTYFRVFRHGTYWYAIDRQMRLLRSSTGIAGWRKQQGGAFIGGSGLNKGTPSPRHTAVLLEGSTLTVFYSRVGDAPERILASTVQLTGNWASWALSLPVEVLTAEFDYEGANLPVGPSDGGDAEIPVHQLRDPAIYADGGGVFLFYAVRGEFGIAGAELSR